MRSSDEHSRLEVSAHLVDARGRACPLPIIDLAKALRIHARVELWADDPAARGDVLAFCEAHAYELVVERRSPFAAVVAKESGR